MNKALLLLSVLGLFALPTRSMAQTPSDYFKAGEFYEFSGEYDYLKAYTKDDLQAKMNDGRQLFVKAGATADVLASYDNMAKVAESLPFDQDYSAWTQDQKDRWQKSGLHVGDWLGDQDSKADFFFWLGSDSLFFAKTCPSQLNDWDFGLDSVQGDCKNVLSDFANFRDRRPLMNKIVSPDVKIAIAAIAKYNSKAVDPMGNGLSADDITALQPQAAIIVAAANADKLTQ